MLKTSPILTSSANASPTGFCRGHAPARPPPSGSPRAPSARARLTASLNASLTSLTASLPVAPTPKSPSRPRARPPNAPNSPPTRDPRETTPPPRPQPLPAPPTPAPSPNKRRGSPSQGTRYDGASRSETADPEHGSSAPEAASKRPRANEQPPKMLPRRYEHCAVEDMVELIAHMLAELIATNDAIRISSGGLTRFHSR